MHLAANLFLCFLSVTNEVSFSNSHYLKCNPISVDSLYKNFIDRYAYNVEPVQLQRVFHKSTGFTVESITFKNQQQVIIRLHTCGGTFTQFKGKWQVDGYKLTFISNSNEKRMLHVIEYDGKLYLVDLKSVQEIETIINNQYQSGNQQATRELISQFNWLVLNRAFVDSN